MDLLRYGGPGEIADTTLLVERLVESNEIEIGVCQEIASLDIIENRRTNRGVCDKILGKEFPNVPCSG